jgi:hypothetical protein
MVRKQNVYQQRRTDSLDNLLYIRTYDYVSFAGV